MKLRLERLEMNPAYTIGKLYVDGAYQCWVLEDTVRPPGEKVHGATAIPFGTYKVILNRSQRFGKTLPLVCNVPDFEGIRIHPGNTPADTDGCLLVGTERAGGTVLNSRGAFNALMVKLVAAVAKGDAISLEVTRPEDPAA